jgi:hypothetical protein
MRSRFRVRVGRGTIRAEVMRGGAVTWAGESAYASEEELTDALATLAALPGLGPCIRVAEVQLEAPLVQVRRLTDLPPVRGSALPALVANQATRFFRRNGKPLVTNAAWERRGRRAPRIAIAAAVEEPWLDAIVTGLRAAGLGVRAIRPAGCRLLLLPKDERLARARRARLRIARLAVLASLLWLAVAGLSLNRLVHDAAALDRELARFEPARASVLAARRRYDEAVAMIRAVERADRARGAVAARTAAILLALPDSAFLTSLHVAGGAAGELSGSARRPSDVIAALERNGAVAAPRLAAPATRDVIGAREYERFTLRFGSASAP